MIKKIQVDYSSPFVIETTESNGSSESIVIDSVTDLKNNISQKKEKKQIIKEL